MHIDLLASYTSNEIFAILLVFSRIGTALMLAPGIGDAYVNPRSRLLLALMLSVVLAPVLHHSLPLLPDSAVTLALMLGAEIVVGLFLGTIMRILLATLHTTGMIISMHSSLATAMLFDTSQSTQGSTFGVFLNAAAILLFFAADLHHVMLAAFADSYTLFAAGHFMPMDEMAYFISELVTRSFRLAFVLASPVMVVSLTVYLGAGVLARLMPAMQVFFVIIPLQILASMAVFAMTLSAVLLWYFDYVEQTMGRLGG